jgi:protein-tyrosine phosphatase
MDGLVDLHTHILPGVDDGADELDESIRMMKGLRELGFTHVFATPHYRLYSWEGIAPVTVLSGVKALREASLEKELDVRLYPGIEYDLDETLAERISQRPGGGGFVLVDIGFWAVPNDLSGLLSQVMESGVEILLAHPERNRELCRKKGQVKSLLYQGVRFTGNLGSLSGLYGDRVRKDCLELLGEGSYWAMASDLHSAEQLPSVQRGLEELRKETGPSAARDLLHHHPMMVVQAVEEEAS